MSQVKTLALNPHQPTGRTKRIVAIISSFGWVLVLSCRLSAFAEPFSAILMLLLFVAARKITREKFWLASLVVGVASILIGLLWWTLPTAFLAFFGGYYASEGADKLMKHFGMPVR